MKNMMTMIWMNILPISEYAPLRVELTSKIGGQIWKKASIMRTKAMTPIRSKKKASLFFPAVFQNFFLKTVK